MTVHHNWQPINSTGQLSAEVAAATTESQGFNFVPALGSGHADALSEDPIRTSDHHCFNFSLRFLLH